jgi:hypothetical protein
MKAISRHPFASIAAAATLFVAVAVGALAVRAAQTDPATAWQPAGLSGDTVHALTFDRAGRLLAATQTGVYRRSGSQWRRLLKSDGTWSVMVVPHTGVLLSGNEEGYVTRSNDGGTRWRRTLISTQGVFAVTATPTGSVLLAGAGGGIFRSTDGGATWRRTLPLPGSAGTTFTWDGNGTTVYAGTVTASVKGATQVFVSHDAGVHWRMAGSRFASHGGIMAVALVPGGTLLAGTMGNAIWRTDALSGGWRKIANGIPPHQHVAGIAVLPHHSARVYIATLAAGVLTTADGGRHWISLASGLPGDSGVQVALAVVVAPQGHTLYAATTNGIYRHPLG